MSLDPLLPDLDLAYEDLPNLHELIDSTRDHGPVVPVRYHGAIAYLVTGYEEVRTAFTDEENYPAKAFYSVHGEPSMGRTMQAMAGEEHRINRAIVSRSFLPRRIRSYVEGAITEEARRLIGTMRNNTELDFMAAFAQPFPFSVITRLVGLPVEDEARFLEWALKLPDYPWDPEGALRARHEFTDYLARVLEQRRAEPREDILSILASAEVDGQRLEDEEIFSLCRLLFPAGSDTTFKGLGSLMVGILKTPGMRERARGSDEERERLVQEGLRWESPVAFQPRTAVADTRLAGVPIPAGSPMLLGITAANRDPKVFDDPHRFDPDRPNSHQHLSFGHGIHFCVGSHLARREMETAIGLLFEHFPEISLIPDQNIEWTGCVFRGPRALRMRLQ